MTAISPEYYKLSKFLCFSFALISLFSAIIIFYLYFSKPHLRTFALRMVVYLQISDSFLSFSIILQIFDPISMENLLCIFQGLIMNYGVSASCFWTVCISTSIYLSVKGLLNNQRKFEIIFCIISFGSSLIMALIPLFLSAYGDADDWCWIKTKDIDPLKRELIVIFELHAFIWLVMSYNIIMIILTFIHLKKMETMLRVEMDENIKKIIYFPICQFFLWTAPSIIRIFQLFNYHNDGLYLIHDIPMALNGLVNTIVYALNNNIRREIRNSFSYNNNLSVVNNQNNITN